MFLLPFIKKYTDTGQAMFDAKYLGGHKMFPKNTDVRVWILDDMLEVGGLGLQVPYSSLTNIENADEKKIKALRVVVLGLVFLPLAIVGALWKKKYIYTILEYVDEMNERQTLVFDFGKNLDKAQATIYRMMIESRPSNKEIHANPVKPDTSLGVVHYVKSTPQLNGGQLCGQCGSSNQVGSLFCSRCGSKLESYCNKCGNKVGEGSVFCNKCGNQLIYTLSTNNEATTDGKDQISRRSPI